MSKQIKIFFLCYFLSGLMILSFLGNSLNQKVFAQSSATDGPNIVIQTLFLDQNNILNVMLQNIGNKDSLKTEIFLRVNLNKNQNTDAAYLAFYLPPLKSTLMYNVATKVKITEGDLVEVWLDTPNKSYQSYSSKQFINLDLLTRAEAVRWAVISGKLPINTANGPHFIDVPSNHPDYQYIETAYNAGIIPSGSSYLYPNNEILKAEFAKILTLTYRLPTSLTTGQSYKDVTPNQWFYKYIETNEQFFYRAHNEYFYPGTIQKESEAIRNLQFMAGKIKPMGVWYSADNSVNQTVKQGQKDVLLLSLDIWGIDEPLILEQINSNNLYCDDILDSYYLQYRGKTIRGDCSKQDGYVNFTNLQLPIENNTKYSLKIYGNIKAEAPAGKSFQFIISKDHLNIESGIIAANQEGFHKLMNYGEELYWELYDFKGGLMTIKSNKIAATLSGKVTGYYQGKPIPITHVSVFCNGTTVNADSQGFYKLTLNVVKNQSTNVICTAKGDYWIANQSYYQTKTSTKTVNIPASSVNISKQQNFEIYY